MYIFNLSKLTPKSIKPVLNSFNINIPCKYYNIDHFAHLSFYDDNFWNIFFSIVYWINFDLIFNYDCSVSSCKPILESKYCAVFFMINLKYSNFTCNIATNFWKWTF